MTTNPAIPSGIFDEVKEMYKSKTPEDKTQCPHPTLLSYLGQAADFALKSHSAVETLEASCREPCRMLIRKAFYVLCDVKQGFADRGRWGDKKTQLKDLLQTMDRLLKFVSNPAPVFLEDLAIHEYNNQLTCAFRNFQFDANRTYPNMSLSVGGLPDYSTTRGATRTFININGQPVSGNRDNREQGSKPKNKLDEGNFSFPGFFHGAQGVHIGGSISTSNVNGNQVNFNFNREKRPKPHHTSPEAHSYEDSSGPSRYDRY
ncbi:hypothetical protein V5O48_009286 [Marasmius crinis-equi]|uniref:Uncharacterized protein n=1 Tax=Marasmius crinis-equi TaxID=585013 RepID=A0ABR3FC40_9AGAR